jgi:hypothetical protein
MAVTLCTANSDLVGITAHAQPLLLLYSFWYGSLGRGSARREAATYTGQHKDRTRAKIVHVLDQRSLRCSTGTPGGTRKHLVVYEKLKNNRDKNVFDLLHVN